MCAGERKGSEMKGARQEKDGKGFSKAQSISCNTKEERFVLRARACTASLAKSSKLSLAEVSLHGTSFF